MSNCLTCDCTFKTGCRGREAKPLRADYFAKRYQRNRTSMLERAKIYQKENETWKKTDRREYFKA